MESLIDIENIRQLRRIPNQIQWDNDMEIYAIEAQRFDIRPFFGDAFFYDILANKTQDKYIDLLDGTEWEYLDNTIQFDGIRMAIAYFAFSRYIQNSSVFISKYGVVNKMNDSSEPADEKTIARLVNQARAAGNAIIEQTKIFLNNNTDTYTLWASASSSKPSWGSKIKCITNYD